MTRHYELTDETMEYRGITLHRVKYHTAFHGFYKDINKGGWIESERNLAEGAYVLDEVKVYGDACVTGNAVVRGNVVIKDTALVSEQAEVNGNIIIKDNARVLGNVKLEGNMVISGNAMIGGYMRLEGDLVVSGELRLFDQGEIFSIPNEQRELLQVTIQLG